MNLLQFIVEHPKFVGIAWIVVIMSALAAIPSIKYSSDNRVFFADDHPEVIRLENMEMKYAHSNQILVALHVKEDTFEKQEHLRQALMLHDALWRVPHVTRVDSIVNYKRLLGSDDALTSENFITAHGLAEQHPSASELRSTLEDPIVANRLVAKNLATLGFIITVALPEKEGDQDPVTQVVGDLKRIVSKIVPPSSAYEAHLSGVVPLMAAFGEAALSDMVLLIPIALIVSSLVVVLLLRSIRYAIGLLCAAGVSALSTIGLWVSLGHAFNTATAVAPIIVMTLCIAAGLHVVIAIRATPATNRKQRVLGGLESTLSPSALALLTTMVSFLAFSGAEAPPLQQMGYIVCTGLVFAYAAIYSLMPIIMLCFHLKPQDGDSRLMARALTRHQGKLAVASLGVFLVGLPGLSQLNLDDDFTQYFDHSFEYRRAADFTQRHLTGQTELHIDLPHPHGREVSEPNYRRAVEEYVEWLRAQAHVSSVVSYLDPLLRVARTFPERDGEIPEDQYAFAEYLLLYEMSLDQGESLSDFIAIDRSSTRVVFLVSGLSSQGIQELIRRGQAFLSSQNFFTDTSLFGLSVLFANLSNSNIKSMLASTAISICIIALVVGITMRATSYGAACLMLGLVPLITGFGIWGWLQGDLGLPGAVIVGLTIGVLIDDCIHFIHRYRFARRSACHIQAVEFAYHTAGAAVLITTVALILGFGMLCFSGFLINAQLGLFSCIVFGLALLYCLGLLPWLLRFSPSTR